MKELVSIVVVSYNSCHTVIETLNSCLTQTYGSQNIDLIISDDCSTDNTIEIIKDWLLSNKEKFNDVTLLRSVVNKGVTKNCNDAWKACNTKWLKTIAADDILDIECIKANFCYLNSINTKKIGVVFSGIQTFNSNGSLLKRTQKKFFQSVKNGNVDVLDYLLLNGGFNLAPSSFINLRALKEVNFSDESVRNIEDYSLWLKIASSQYEFQYFDFITVHYRVAESVSFSNEKIINIRYLEDKIKSTRLSLNYTSSLFIKLALFERWFYLIRLKFITKLFYNKRNIYSESIVKLNKLLSINGFIERYYRGKYGS